MGHWRDRLPPAKRRVYDRSDAVTSVPLRPGPALLENVRQLDDALSRKDRASVARLAQHITDGICVALRVPGLRVVVQGRRPSSSWGELHGIYTPGERRQRDTVKVWMITAKRGQVVAFRTFLRTLVHEICHHLDYTLLKLPDSLHSDGFYIRESKMVRLLTNGAAFESAGTGAVPGRGPEAKRRSGRDRPGGTPG